MSRHLQSTLNRPAAGAVVSALDCQSQDGATGNVSLYKTGQTYARSSVTALTAGSLIGSASTLGNAATITSGLGGGGNR